GEKEGEGGGRVVLRAGDIRQGRERGSSCCHTQELTARKLHGSAPKSVRGAQGAPQRRCSVAEFMKRCSARVHSWPLATIRQPLREMEMPCSHGGNRYNRDKRRS